MAWNPYTEAEFEESMVETKNREIASWKRILERCDLDDEPDLNRIYDEFHDIILDKMRGDYDLLRVEGGSYALYPKSWKTATTNPGGVELLLNVGCEGGMLSRGAPIGVMYHAFDYDGHWCGMGYYDKSNN